MISQKDKSYISFASKIAHNCTDNQKHGAIIVLGSRVISFSKNMYLNSRHAEESAILKISRIKNLRGATIYVARLRKEQPFGLSKPCEHCYKLIQRFGIRRVVYTTNCPHEYIEEMFV